MKTSTDTRRSFRNAILAVLSTDRDTWPEPVIYAEAAQVEGPYPVESEIRFHACNAPAMPTNGDAVVWLYVEADTFGDLTGCAEIDAHGIELNMFEQAINDVIDAFVLA